MPGPIIYNDVNPEEIEKTMACARWLVNEFYKMNCPSLGNLFQRTVEDAEIWIHHMSSRSKTLAKLKTNIENGEAQYIHDILVKYASIQNPEIRRSIINKMQSIIEHNSAYPRAS